MAEVVPKHEIAILGAGIGGLALAIGLSKRGIPVTVYEAATEFSPVGAGIGLGPNALQAIELLNSSFRLLYESAKTENEKPQFEHSIFDALYAEEGLDFGERLGWSRGLVGASYFTRSSAHRKDLLNIMKSLIPEEIVKFGKRAMEIIQTDNKATVSFEDGETISADALVGCDGIKGMTRSAVLQNVAPEEVPAKYCNMYIYRGIVPMEDAKKILGKHAGDAKWFMSQGKGVAVYPISKGKEENFVFFVRDLEPWQTAQEAVDCTHEEMLADLASFDRRLLKLLDWAKPLKWPIFHHPNTQTYYHGRICLLGDVAHASSPGQAAGAGQGLEDAVVLSHLFSLTTSASHIPALFEAYDAVRRTRAQSVVQTSQEAGEMYSWNLPGIGNDMQKIVDNANDRLHWIWQHDIQQDVKRAETMFYDIVRSSRSASVPETFTGAVSEDSIASDMKSKSAAMVQTTVA
ncbi:6-methylsalicylic acid decarboxylase atA [Pseudocercospora fuligena]|uniref:6-methylsalicylic acid decarboxylase atA n=1 Tax=Pseudocercospora fuligena TaxID=685502 RepID=A0A8H6RTP8_9PEZI|nr:6-methylsalicylic acid decarboxylase atA [Pseudocercospora fuligena]